MTDPVEAFWDDILSREAERVRKAFATLDEETRLAVIAHLERMVEEEGWHPAQRVSAKAALDALEYH